MDRQSGWKWTAGVVNPLQQPYLSGLAGKELACIRSRGQRMGEGSFRLRASLRDDSRLAFWAIGFSIVHVRGRVLTWLAEGQRILPAGELAGYRLPTCLPNSWDSGSVVLRFCSSVLGFQISCPTLCSYCFLL